MDTAQKKNSSFRIKTGRDVARYLIYFSKLNKVNQIKEINIVNISGITMYRKHKELLDKSMVLQDKYGIDLVDYTKFFVSKYRLTDKNLKNFLNSSTVYWYAQDIFIKVKYSKVYNYIEKSVDNIVKECISKGFATAKEYLKYLIQENKLAYKYLSGEISGYYLSGIRNLGKIVNTMDSLNRETLKEVVDNKDKLESDMQDAFTYFKISRISVISYTNDRLMNALKTIKQSS